MKQLKPIQLLLLIGQLGLFVALLFFFWSRISDLASNLDWSIVPRHLPEVLLVMLLVCVFYGVLSVHWLFTCRLVDPKTDKVQVLSFFASQPYKYLPTSIFTFSSRARFSSRLGMSLKKSSAAQLVENFNLIGSALGLGVAIYVLQHSLLFFIGLALVTLIILFALWYKKEVYISKFKKSISIRSWMVTLSISLCAWVISGLGFALTAHVFGSPTTTINMIAANAIAFGASILAVFAPGGLGVRETIFTYFSVALGAIVMWRLVTMLLDGFLGIIAALAIRRKLTNSPD